MADICIQGGANTHARKYACGALGLHLARERERESTDLLCVVHGTATDCTPSPARVVCLHVLRS
ncbi:hypothetical protein EON67_05070 [archaeon]|nr:MAG: hypothetical protein EON67_05070 [archaeon]